MQNAVSIEAALARIQQIETAFSPQAPQTTTAPAAAGGASFADTLNGAIGAAPATTPTQAAGAGAASPSYAPASAGQFPHLDGDLDSNPELLRRLEALAARKGMHFHITSGLRTYAEQMRLWNARGSNPFPVARPGTSRHESGNAADVVVGGRPIQTVFPAAELRAAGLAPLAGDAVHVELPH
jgi:hypothetical protein